LQPIEKTQQNIDDIIKRIKSEIAVYEEAIWSV